MLISEDATVDFQRGMPAYSIYSLKAQCQLIRLIRRQANMCHEVSAKVADGDQKIIEVMLESNLVAGAQKLVPGQPLVYGQSITDAYLGWDDTLPLLYEHANAGRSRRRNAKQLSTQTQC